jgi:hypothetical protein
MLARVFIAVLAAVGAVTATAIPANITVERLVKRATNPPTYSNCVNSGQIALTFDGTRR